MPGPRKDDATRMIRYPIPLLALVLSVSPADAAVTLGFLSRDFGEVYPHAYIELTGTTDADPGHAVDANYGFTAISATPAVLLGPVAGEVMSVNAVYRRKSQRHFSVRLTDARYAEILALVDRWRTRPGKTYSLNRRNCVHFVAAVARAVGLSADDDPKLMKKPRSFLEKVTRANPQVDTGDAFTPEQVTPKRSPAQAGAWTRPLHLARPDV